MKYVTAKTQGVSSIAEGRIFLLDSDEWRKEGLIPPTIEEAAIDYRGEPCEMMLAGPNMQIRCPECNSILKKQLIHHNHQWMKMVFYCDKHPKIVWLDLFPKANGGSTTWDRMNEWFPSISSVPDRRIRVLSPEHENPALTVPIDDIVENFETDYERNRRNIETAPLRYILTPKGLCEFSLQEKTKKHWLMAYFIKLVERQRNRKDI